MSTGILGLDNTAIAARLDEYAALLELAGAGYYNSRAYRRAAEVIRGTPAPIAELVRAGRVRDLNGIGPGIERRLRELVETGKLVELDELKQTVSVELAALGRLLGVGTQRATETDGSSASRRWRSFVPPPRMVACARCPESGRRQRRGFDGRSSGTFRRRLVRS